MRCGSNVKSKIKFTRGGEIGYSGDEAAGIKAIGLNLGWVGLTKEELLVGRVEVKGIADVNGIC